MTSLTDRTITLADVTFHYREAGEASTPPLILLHGLGDDARGWDEIAPMLAECYHVFALDQRGNSESARPAVYSFELMRDDLKAFADALGLDRFTLVGHSMGGSVSILFAEQWPERLVRLVLEDTPPPYPGGMDLSEPEPPAEAPENEEILFDWQMLRAIVHQLRHPDPSWWNDLSTITTPTLVIAGGSTSHVPQDKLAEAARLIPDCRFVTIEGAGHAVHKNRPQEYKGNLRDFLFT